MWLETQVGELQTVRAAVRHMIRHLGRWMRPERKRVALPFAPSRAEVRRVPLGVVGVISPWNYPFQLAMLPLATALAAGNRVMLKPSELTPRTAALLQDMLDDLFEAEQVSVHQGDATLGRAFSELPFDHLFFTGSTAVGRAVAQAAAANLTPVTLELGGKSPAIVAADADLTKAAEAIALGRLFNAGQTCVAADYVIVDAAVGDALVQALRRAMARLFPNPAGNADYSSLITRGHAERLEAMVADAVAKGGTVIRPDEKGTSDDPCRFEPVIVAAATPDMRVMQEEIFGPVLPILRVDDAAAIPDVLNAAGRPLALYWFGRDRQPLEAILERCPVGGVTVNGVFLHMAQENLPFGGVGESGQGSYHGEDGFLQLSKKVPVFTTSPLSPVGGMYPPYGDGFRRNYRLMRLLT